MKDIVQTSLLSRRWKDLSKILLCSTINLDFDNEFTSKNHTPQQFVATINYYMELHDTKKIKRLQLFLHPEDAYISDAHKWIQLTTTKGVEELHLNFSQGFVDEHGQSINGRRPFQLPPCLFYSKELYLLKLSHCSFIPPSEFTAFGSHQTLSLDRIHISATVLQNLILYCPLLENLKLVTPDFTGDFDLNLKILVTGLRLKNLILIDCVFICHMEISAPNLQSFHYVGELYCEFFFNIPSLVDAFISSMGREYAEPEQEYLQILSDIAHVKILTVCTATLIRASWEEFRNSPIVLQNLQELQLLIEWMDEYYLACMYSFFRVCRFPILQQLFIQLPIRPEANAINGTPNAMEQPLDGAFNHLRMIKINNFKGCMSEIKLVIYFLKNGVNLETLILITPQKSKIDSEAMEVLHKLVSSSPKASLGTQIVLCEYPEENCYLHPTHTRLYEEYEF
ncbi:F-box/LRR-repeat protein 13 [Acorus gramineus]|uniref:F-box/LRR-repeat protein 13 n=1 Tax=Acorus gramineus TaxID=55184 RepID=A0AAV9BTI1_ACOGR|nr:F-box/LRR-repeat protein 13 [Acorus gramineus]